MITRKNIALTVWTFICKVMSLFVIIFLQRNKCLLISWLQSPSPIILEPCTVFMVAQSCPLCDPMSCSSPGSSVHGDSQSKNTVVNCHALLQGIFPTQGSNTGLPHCRWILYNLSHVQASQHCREGSEVPGLSQGYWFPPPAAQSPITLKVSAVHFGID